MPGSERRGNLGAQDVLVMLKLAARGCLRADDREGPTLEFPSTGPKHPGGPNLLGGQKCICKGAKVTRCVRAARRVEHTNLFVRLVYNTLDKALPSYDFCFLCSQVVGLCSFSLCASARARECILCVYASARVSQCVRHGVRVHACAFEWACM